MRLCRYSITLAIYFTSLSLGYSSPSTATQNLWRCGDGVFCGGETVFRNPAIFTAKHLSTSPSFKVLDLTTIWDKNVFVSLNPESTTKSKQPKERDFVWWLIVAIAILGSTGALLFLIKSLREQTSYAK